MELDLEATTQGVIVTIQAQPGARRCGIIGVHAGRLKVAVTQVAEKGKANQALIETLAEELGVKRSQIQILSGLTNSQKKVLVIDMNVDQFRQLVDALLE